MQRAEDGERNPHTKVWAVPAQSREKSTPPLVSSVMTSWTGLSRSLGLRQSVAPRALALGNFSLLMSTAMILEAPAALHPITAERPTQPRPKTAQVEPGVTCRREKYRVAESRCSQLCLFWGEGAMTQTQTLKNACYKATMYPVVKTCQCEGRSIPTKSCKIIKGPLTYQFIRSKPKWKEFLFHVALQWC